MGDRIYHHMEDVLSRQAKETVRYSSNWIKGSASCHTRAVRRFNKENIPSRAYIAFKNEEHLAVFSREYDGHVFRDKSGPLPPHLRANLGHARTDERPLLQGSNRRL
jgi:hypothetical protein